MNGSTIHLNQSNKSLRYSLISASSCSLDLVNGCRLASHALPGWNQSQEGVIMLLRPQPGAWFPKPSSRQFHTGLNRSITIDSASGIQLSSTARKRQRKTALLKQCSRYFYNSIETLLDHNVIFLLLPQYLLQAHHRYVRALEAIPLDLFSSES